MLAIPCIDAELTLDRIYETLEFPMRVKEDDEFTVEECGREWVLVHSAQFEPVSDESVTRVAMLMLFMGVFLGIALGLFAAFGPPRDRVRDWLELHPLRTAVVFGASGSLMMFGALLAVSRWRPFRRYIEGPALTDPASRPSPLGWVQPFC